MVGYDEHHQLELGPDPLVLELNRHQNLVKEREREIAVARAEIKALRATDASKDKAIEELRNEVCKLDEKLRATENIVELKNLDIKKLSNEKKDALAAQYAAEATLRRLHADLKDDDSPPLQSLMAPLEADIRMYKSEVAALLEDKKAMERMTRSKELALLEAERILQSALERALIVEEVQNENYDLKRQIEICQEENRILEKTNRQKVLEVEKLSQTIQDLEEAILAGGATANAIRDCQRRITELNEEKRMLERELARAKVSANRVATIVANEWKDENDKVMPVRQWLEERRLMQAEMQRLRDKLAVSERTARVEAQLKEKLKLRLKTLEEGLKHVSSFSVDTNPLCSSPKQNKASILGFLASNGLLRKRSTSQPRGSTVARNTSMQRPDVEVETANAARELKQSDSFKGRNNSREITLKKKLWASRSKVVDNNGKENAQLLVNTGTNPADKQQKQDDVSISSETKNKDTEHEEPDKESTNTDVCDVVSGFLYDRLQKEVISLRKHCEAKDNFLSAKDQEIQMLVKKVDALAKALEAESKRAKRETAVTDRESAHVKVDQPKKAGITHLPKRANKIY